ncbi:hypothetical protein FN846DRAFT_906105 [Sphaerosporella brunnea]|uniref:Uncharacterized protein n=1 Tax=Sphaerosporella brunnea TaxID=1250544 RepID=A0A5J5EZV3_9PEZI|nr:hypothetical protein FN846DRAFT_906105 [Sphaerosporella brunnea]
MSAPTARQTRSTRLTPTSVGSTASSCSAANQPSSEIEGSAIAPTTNTPSASPTLNNNVVQRVLAAFSSEERESALARLPTPRDHGSASAPSASDLEGNGLPFTLATHIAPPAAHIALATTNHAIVSIHDRYPAIDPTYLKQILENRFQPENIIKRWCSAKAASSAATKRLRFGTSRRRR